jgi:pyridoxal phosphate enzyme (YggS family)
MANFIQENLQKLLQEIRVDEAQYQRPPHSVKLLAVSKNQSDENILIAYENGQRLFGENYLQEALSKIERLQDKNIEWHFIGSVQKNKTRKIAENFAWIHTISDFKIAERLHNQRPSTLPPLNICLQVNISSEPSKAGIASEAVLTLAQQCKTLSRLSLRGLMCIPVESHDFAAQVKPFRQMKKLFDTCNQHGLKLDVLSMGMSSDLHAAIAEGSTMIRIGTRIFGRRQQI